MVLRLLEKDGGNSPKSHRFNSRLHFQGCWISDHLPRSKYAVTDNGSRHIHGQAPSEGQVMNQEGRDQTCRNQPDLCVIMISLAVASRIISPWKCLHLNFS